MALPPKELLQYFERMITPSMELILNTQRETMSLLSLRDALVPKLFSGELTLPQEGTAMSEVVHV